MKEDLNQTYQRTRQYWFIDGLAELAFGAICLLLAVYFTLQVTLPRETLLANLLDSSFVLVLIGGSFLANRVVVAAKSRLTYPRTGYVSYPKNGPGKRWLGAGVAMLMGILASALMAATPASYAWMPAITGFILSVALLIFGYRIDLARFYILAAVSILLGSFLAIIGIGNIPGLAWFYALIGVALLISGAYTLRSYMRANQPEQNN